MIVNLSCPIVRIRPNSPSLSFFRLHTNQDGAAAIVAAALRGLASVRAVVDAGVSLDTTNKVRHNCNVINVDK